MGEALNIEGSSRHQLVDLKPGEIHVAQEPTFITTLLGSCVAVCLYSPADSVGAMSHSVLVGNLIYSHNPSDVRYVECAIGRMLDELSGIGIKAGHLKAKLFGGAEMFHRGNEEVRLARIVGTGNIDTAKRILRDQGIGIISECVGGRSGRKVIFDSASGAVFLRKLTHNPAGLYSPVGKSA